MTFLPHPASPCSQDPGGLPGARGHAGERVGWGTSARPPAGSGCTPASALTPSGPRGPHGSTARVLRDSPAGLACAPRAKADVIPALGVQTPLWGWRPRNLLPTSFPAAEVSWQRFAQGTAQARPRGTWNPKPLLGLGLRPGGGATADLSHLPAALRCHPAPPPGYADL